MLINHTECESKTEYNISQEILSHLKIPTALDNFLVNMSMCALKDNWLSSVISKYFVHLTVIRPGVI